MHTRLGHVHLRELKHPRHDGPLKRIQAPLVAALPHLYCCVLPLLAIGRPPNDHIEPFFQLLHDLYFPVPILQCMPAFVFTERRPFCRAPAVFPREPGGGFSGE